MIIEKLWAAARPKPAIPKHLVMTTFPQHRSANVGDALIASSFLELVRYLGLVDEVELRFRRETLDDDVLQAYGSQPIFLPGMSISNDLYPKLYALHSEFERIPAGLIPFGCTWQHPIGLPEHFERCILDGPTPRLLQHIASHTGPIAVRDHMAEWVLRQNNIPSITVGDCAWYHLPSRGEPMRRVTEVKRIAVTTPHHVPLAMQSMDVLKLVREIFPAAEIILSVHSRPTAHVHKIMAFASEMGVQVLQAAGDIAIFDRYEGFDLHVGHRLHGHIGFLRRRIPSVLLLEDARSRGFSSSIPVGCFPAFRSGLPALALADMTFDEAYKHQTDDPMAVPRIAHFLRQEVASGFLRYIGVAPYLDQMLEQVVLPTLVEKYHRAKRT
jgi:hypothetical protein